MPIVKANGVDLYYEEAGPSRAPVVVFAHSVGCSLDIWDAQFAALSERYRCIRYDARGHGRSASVDQPTTMADLATDLAGLFDALGIDSAHIAGLSIGGLTAQVEDAGRVVKVCGAVVHGSARMRWGEGEGPCHAVPDLIRDLRHRRTRSRIRSGTVRHGPPGLLRRRRQRSPNRRAAPLIRVG